MESAPIPAMAEEYTIKSPQRRFIRPVERQRMRPWLIDHLDKNDIAGLCWQSKREKIFRIAWKHAANQCFNMEKDTSLFEKWAIHTGRHFDSDHKRWKANFRCALNSLPDVAEMKDQGIRKGNNAFKVYKFLDEKDPKLVKEIKQPGQVKDKKKKEPVTQGRDTEDNYSDGSDTDKLYIKDVIEGQSSTVESKTDLSGDHNYAEFGAQSSCLSDQTWHTGSQRDTANLPRFEELNSPTQNVDLLVRNTRGMMARVTGIMKSEQGSSDTDTGHLSISSSGFTSLEQILAAASQSFGESSGSLSSVSLDQLVEDSAIRLDVRSSEQEGKSLSNTPSTTYMYRCQWCDKCFSDKLELFQHFVYLHQDMLVLTGSVRADANTTGVQDNKTRQQLQQEIAVLEEEVFKNYKTPNTETVIEDGEVLDLSLNNDLSNQDMYVASDLALDLSVKSKTLKRERQEEALDLTTKRENRKVRRSRSSSQGSRLSTGIGGKNKLDQPGHGSVTNKEPGIKTEKEDSDIGKEGGEPVLRQHSFEDILHAEILMSLKTGVSSDSPSGEVSPAVERKQPDVKTKKKKVQKIIKSNKKSSNLDRVIDGVAKDSEDRECENSGNKKLEVTAAEVAVSSEGVITGSLLAEKDGKAAVTARELEMSGKKEEDDDVLIPDLKEMIKASSATYPYKCVVCGRLYTRDIYLIAHLRSHSGLILYRCGICGKTFADNGTLRRHVKTHKKPFLYECTICNEGFQHSFALKLHMKEHKSVDSVPEEFFQAVVPEKVYKCKLCGKRLRQGIEVNVHIQAHQSRTCKICNTEFDNLSSHMKNHVEERPYICNLCEKSFSLSSALTTHVKSHLRDKIVFMGQLKRQERRRQKKMKKEGCETEKTAVSSDRNKPVTSEMEPVSKALGVKQNNSTLAAALTQPAVALNTVTTAVKTTSQLAKSSIETRTEQGDSVCQGMNIQITDISPTLIVRSVGEAPPDVSVTTERGVNNGVFISALPDVITRSQSWKSDCVQSSSLVSSTVPKSETSSRDPSLANRGSDVQQQFAMVQGQESGFIFPAGTFQGVFLNNLISKERNNQSSTPVSCSQASTALTTSSSQSKEKGSVKSRLVNVNLSSGKVGESGITWVCTVCEEGFPMYKALESHMTSHLPAGELFECRFCGRKFKAKSTLTIHCKKMHPLELSQVKGVKGFACGNCKQLFPTEHSLKYHIVLKHGVHQANLVCPHCSNFSMVTEKLSKVCKVWQDSQGLEYVKEELRQHLNKVEPDKGLLCKECGRQFIGEAELKSHLEEHSSVIPYMCHGCEGYFDGENSFADHLKKCSKAQTLLQCEICHTFFSCKENLKKHTHFHDLNMACTVCHTWFPTMQQLKTHQTETHEDCRKQKEFKCVLCLTLCDSESNLNLHLKTHTEIGPFTCSVCWAYFRKRYQFCAHALHHPNYFASQQSSSSDETEVALKSMDSGSRKCLAETGKQPQSSKFKAPVNTAEKKHMCSACGMMFVSRFQLKQHSVFTHSCPRTRNLSYSQHVLENLKRPKSYSCKKCGKSFDLQSTLLWHLRFHVSNKVFGCDQCSSSFRSKRALVNHRLLHKKESSVYSVNTVVKATQSHDFELESGRKKLPTVEDSQLTESMHSQDSLRCSFCTFTSVGQACIRDHILKCHPDHVHICQRCDFIAFNRQALKEHEKCHSCESEVSKDLKSKDLPMYGEPMLAPGDSTDNSNVLRSKEKDKGKKKRIAQKEKGRQKRFIMTKKRIFGCGLCNKSFFKPLKLSKHIWDHRQSEGSKTMATKHEDVTGPGQVVPNVVADVTQEKWYMCTICRSRFHDSSELFKHAKTHASEEREGKEIDKVQQSVLQVKSSTLKTEQTNQTSHVQTEQETSEAVVTKQNSSKSFENENYPQSDSLFSYKCDLCGTILRFQSMNDVCAHAVSHMNGNTG